MMPDASPEAPEFDELLSTDEIARVLSVTTETVRNYIKSGMLTGIRLNRQWRVSRSSFVAFLNDRHGASGTTTVNHQGQRITR